MPSAGFAAIHRAILASLLLAAAGAGGISVAQAQDATPMTCVAAGKSYRIGDVACIPACHGSQRLARCELSTTGVSWTPISDSCPSARSTPAAQSVMIATADATPWTLKATLQ